jgi:thymidylate synthase
MTYHLVHHNLPQQLIDKYMPKNNVKLHHVDDAIEDYYKLVTAPQCAGQEFWSLVRHTGKVDNENLRRTLTIQSSIMSNTANLQVGSIVSTDNIVNETASIMIHRFEWCANIDEYRYLDTVRRLALQPVRETRSEPTRGTFGEQLRFKLYREDLGQIIIPLLTTKKMSITTIVWELLWFLRGSTDTKFLKEHGVKIWDGNSTREYLDSRGLKNMPEGYVGPIYGYQWRRWAGHIDQLAGLIKGLREDPMSRRHVVSAWNPSDLGQMALPPCHYSFQLLVGNALTGGAPSTLLSKTTSGAELTLLSKTTSGAESTLSPLATSEGRAPQMPVSILVNMRSADICLGVPYNIVSYTLLLVIICQILNNTTKDVKYRPEELILNIGDAHIYSSHVAPAAEQTARQPRSFPTLLASKKLEAITTIDEAAELSPDDFILLEYNPYPLVKYKMVV